MVLLRVAWPSSVKGVFSALSVVNINAQLWALPCIGSSNFDPWILQLLLPLVVQPLVIVASAASLWWKRYLLRRGSNGGSGGGASSAGGTTTTSNPLLVQQVPFWKLYLSFNILFLSALNIPILVAAVAPFSCYTFESGETTMMLAPDVKCYTTDGSWLLAFVVPSLVALVVFGFGTVALYSYVLWLHHSRTRKPGDIKIERPKTRSIAPFNINCLFFPPRFWWWKLLEFAENAAIVCSVALVPNLLAQCLVVSAIVLGTGVARYLVRRSVPSDYLYVHHSAIIVPAFMFAMLMIAVMTVALSDYDNDSAAKGALSIILCAIVLPLIGLAWIGIDVRRRNTEASRRGRLFDSDIYASAMKLVLERMLDPRRNNTRERERERERERLTP